MHDSQERTVTFRKRSRSRHVRSSSPTQAFSSSQPLFVTAPQVGCRSPRRSPDVVRLLEQGGRLVDEQVLDGVRRRTLPVTHGGAPSRGASDPRGERTAPCARRGATAVVLTPHTGVIDSPRGGVVWGATSTKHRCGVRARPPRSRPRALAHVGRPLASGKGSPLHDPRAPGRLASAAPA